MNRSTSYPAEVRERAVRMVIDRWQEYDSQWAAIRFIAGKLGMSPRDAPSLGEKSRDRHPAAGRV